MKKYNLTDLLDGEILVQQDEQLVAHELEGIEIPIIQRDYAQGRENVAHIRNRFLNAIFNALSESEELELDFVYGSIKTYKRGNQDVNVFLPLDGQQRLTTLFLIYWFVANTELEGEELDKVRKKLMRFSYATRTTARTFCEKISKLGYTKNKEIDSKKHQNRGLAVDEITGSYWFYKNYENDPTVMGMLNTLADIQEKYEKLKIKNIFQNLEKLCFYILPLDGFDLTDELYIKMNARGKPLTDFENYKADLINWMKSEENKEKNGFEEKVSLGARVVPKYLSIASSFDNKWTDIFWSVAITNEKDENKIIDGYFLRFINRYFLNKFIVSTEKSGKNIEESTVFQFLYSEKSDGNITYETFDDYKSLMTLNNIKSLEQVLNKLHKHQSVIREMIKPIWDSTANWFLYDSKIIQVQRILFLAVTEYLEKNDFEELAFKNWMRIVWNIIVDPDIRSIGLMITAMKTVSKLANQSSDIYSYILSADYENINLESENIHKAQLREEHYKLQLFEIPNMKDEILKAEAHPLFQGNIGFLLSPEIDLELFKLRVKNAFSIFNKSGTNHDFIKDFGVYRYVISQFSNYDEIDSFNYDDGLRNWQLVLRRNSSVKSSIVHLCSLQEEIEEVVEDAIKNSSLIEDINTDKVRLSHFNLYAYPEFVKWTQKKEKLTKIKWLNGFIYQIRPGAWYDKVMIDGYRNEIINSFCQLAEISTKTRCGLSNFFIGENIDFEFKIDELHYKIVFDRDNKIEIFEHTNDNDLLDWKLILTNECSKAKSINEAKSLAEELWKKINNFIINVE